MGQLHQLNQRLSLVANLWPWKREVQPSLPTGEDAPTDEREGILRAVAEALPDPCITLDLSGMVTAANEKARELLGLDPAGQHLSAAIRSPSVLEALDRVYVSKAPAQVDYEVRGTPPRHFEAIVSPVVRRGGIVAVFFILKDLTREQRIERLRADFVANASHELRTPLASLLGFIETLQGPARNDEKARSRFLELMLTQAQRMKRLIDDLLSLSRIEMSEHVPPTAEIDLSLVAQHVADVLSPLARENGAEIAMDVTPELLITGEWDELVQVVQNLVENAIKYASGGKRIELSTRRENGHAELSVRDYGPGIAIEHLPRLTERFYRVSVQDSRARGGTGLGLAIVKHILNRHRGRLSVQSFPGAGTTFTIRLPINAIHSRNRK
jgi:two-component system phosphate regulon sensor histidine kinase PhoR